MNHLTKKGGHMKEGINWSKTIIVSGFIAMLVGALDPLEGSLLILPGSALLAWGTWLKQQNSVQFRFRLGLFICIAIGVSALFIVSTLGGFGGESDLSWWWSSFILLYILGWSAEIWGPGSPRWVLWTGIGVSLWYVGILIMALRTERFLEDADMMIAPIALTAVALITLAGCIIHLKKYHDQRKMTV